MLARLATKGNMTSHGVLSVVFKIPKCTSPPIDRDGQRENGGRGVRELQAR